MKIDSSNVAMQGSSEYKRSDITYVESNRLYTSVLMSASELEQAGLAQPEAKEEEEAATLSLGEQNNTKGLYSPKKITGTGIFGDWKLDLQSRLIKAFLRALQKESSSFKIDEDFDSLKRLLNYDEWEKEGDKPRTSYSPIKPFSNSNVFQNNMPVGRAVREPVFEVVNRSGSTRVSRETFIENSMSFATTAQVKTSDGRLIDIDLQLNMSQSLYEKFDFESVFSDTVVKQAVMKDPLVVNFDIPSAMLKNTKFEFDIDVDGSADSISKLGSGSGFLSYDINGDGMINDGAELFGAKTGNGFAELANHDQDGNNWIDENDEIFAKLKVWVVNDDGTHTLFGLAEMNIGAIYLGNVETDYALGDLSDPDGMIRRTGFFLYEDGRAGTIQHVDLKV